MVSFCVFNFGLIVALAIAIFLVCRLSKTFGCLVFDAAGSLYANNNARAKAFWVVAVILWIEAAIVYMFFGAPASPLVDGVAEVKVSLVQKMDERGMDRKAFLKGFVITLFGSDRTSSDADQALDHFIDKWSAEKPEKTKARPSLAWLAAALLSTIMAAVYVPFAYREETLAVIVSVATALKKKRTGVGTSTVGQPAGGADTSAPAEPRHDQTGRTDWKRWLSPAWWIEYMLDDVLAEIIANRSAEGVTGFLRRFRR